MGSHSVGDTVTLGRYDVTRQVIFSVFSKSISSFDTIH